MDLRERNLEELKKMLELVERQAIVWARECGMKGDVRLTEPKEEYFGFTVIVQDDKGHLAQARFNKEGRRQMWEMSGS